MGILDWHCLDEIMPSASKTSRSRPALQQRGVGWPCVRDRRGVCRRLGLLTSLADLPDAAFTVYINHLLTPSHARLNKKTRNGLSMSIAHLLGVDWSLVYSSRCSLNTCKNHGRKHHAASHRVLQDCAQIQTPRPLMPRTQTRWNEQRKDYEKTSREMRLLFRELN